MPISAESLAKQPTKTCATIARKEMEEDRKYGPFSDLLNQDWSKPTGTVIEETAQRLVEILRGVGEMKR